MPEKIQEILDLCEQAMIAGIWDGAVYTELHTANLHLMLAQEMALEHLVRIGKPNPDGSRIEHKAGL
jgi:hypothetical protein